MSYCYMIVQVVLMMSIILLKAKIKTQVDQPNNAHRLKTKLPDTDTISSIDSAKNILHQEIFN